MAMTSSDWLGLGIGGGSLLGGLLSSGSGDANITAATKDLQTNAKGAQKTGQEALSAGMPGLEQALKYFSALSSGNPADLLAATAPERSRVLDQYDTARATTMRSLPRGGGMAATMGGINAKEASDLATQTLGARQRGAEGVANIGNTLASLGINAEQLASGDLSSVINAMLSQQKQQGEASSGFWGGLGKLAATALTVL